MLLPPSLEELIGANHPVRVVNDVIDRINIEPLLKLYKPGGTSVYHPRMMLKVLVYGYLSNIFSSRKLEASIKENIHFMWLSGMSQPDHNTLARFRSDRLKDALRDIFGQIVMLLVEEGLVNIKNIYTDGTKIEANANKYSFVWRRSITYNKERIREQLDELWQYTQQMAKDELAEEVPADFTEVNAEKVRETIARIDQALDNKVIDKKVRQKLNYARRTWPEKLEEYEQQQQVMGTRNSCSKTDPEATFMRMKEDHMLNGQLKPAYNLQISSSDQFVINYSLHQNPNDTLTLKPHLEAYKALYQSVPESICADAGYGSEENYEHLQQEGIDNYVKYNYFHKEQSKKWKEDPFRAENLHYDQQADQLYCPAGNPMENIGVRKTETSSGYTQTYSQYQAKECHQCPLRADCYKAEGNRVVDLNHNLRKHKEQVRKKLNSPQGLAHRSKRPWDVETVFASFKHNKGFKRFMLKGLEKVEIEAGLLAIAHNLAKKAA